MKSGKMRGKPMCKMCGHKFRNVRDYFKHTCDVDQKYVYG